MKKILALTLLALWLLPPAAFSSDKNSIKLRVVAVNPSAEKTQKVPIKIYLPKEIIPDDIISMGELKVGYDTDKSLYFAYSDGAELKPKETRVFEVALEDVWKIKDEEMTKLRTQMGMALKHLEKTPYLEQAKTIVGSIENRFTEVLAKQNDTTISREEHIGAYRINLKIMEEVKSDIALIEKMLQTSGGPPSVEFLKDTVFERKDDLDRVTAWKLILAIVGFLALLGVGFYVKWFFAIKSRRSSNLPDGGTVSGETIPFISENVEEHVGLSRGKSETDRKVG